MGKGRGRGRETCQHGVQGEVDLNESSHHFNRGQLMSRIKMKKITIGTKNVSLF